MTEMKNEENGEYLNLFSVPIQITRLELDIDSLIEFCYEIKRKDEKGVNVSNVGGWQSSNIIKETHTEFIKLKNKIEEATNLYHRKLQFKKTMKQTMVNIWGNINGNGHSNEFHLHSRTVLSGAFYLTVEKTTPIIFRHPYQDINNFYWDLSFLEKGNDANSSEWTLKPEPNMLLIFPPWIWHKVPTNKEDTDRISLSFNTQLQDKDTNL